jgi:hypothetical protein
MLRFQINHLVLRNHVDIGPKMHKNCLATPLFPKIAPAVS